MFFNALALFVGIISLVILAAGLRLLVRGGWLLGWLRGMSGAVIVCLAIVFALVALDIRTYQALTQEKPIATISFEKLGHQRFRASLIFPDNGLTESFDLSGDQWQLDARVIRWKGWMKGLGGKPGYRLDRISGRYFMLEDERSKPRTVYELSRSEYGMDVWAIARKSNEKLPWVDAGYGSATYVPMADGALYEVGLSQTGLVAKPLNPAAKAAISHWY